MQVGYDGCDFVVEVWQGGEFLQVCVEVFINCVGVWVNCVVYFFGEIVFLISGYFSMVVIELIFYFLFWSLGVEGGFIYCCQVVCGNVVLGGGCGYEQDELCVCVLYDFIFGLLLQVVVLLLVLCYVYIICSWSGVEGYLLDYYLVIGFSIM